VLIRIPFIAMPFDPHPLRIGDALLSFVQLRRARMVEVSSEALARRAARSSGPSSRPRRHLLKAARRSLRRCEELARLRAAVRFEGERRSSSTRRREPRLVEALSQALAAAFIARVFSRPRGRIPCGDTSRDARRHLDAGPLVVRGDEVATVFKRVRVCGGRPSSGSSSSRFCPVNRR